MKESSWHRLVGLARSLGTGIRLHEDMRRQSFGDVFTQISHIYFNSPAVYRDDKCQSLPFWKRHAYKDRAYSNAVSEAFRLFCRSEIEKSRDQDPGRRVHTRLTVSRITSMNPGPLWK